MTVSNSNRSYSESNTSSKEIPHFQFRGVFIPAEIMYEIVGGGITKAELLILLLVESLVKSRNEGCWATNKYIANSIGSSTQHVADSIMKLCESKLLIRYEKDGRRHLETAWSHTVHDFSEVRNFPKGGSEFSEGGVRNFPKQKSIKDEVGTKRSSGNSILSGKKAKKTKKCPDKSPKKPANKSVKKVIKKKKIDPKFIAWAHQLHRIIRKKDKAIPLRNFRAENWAEEFESLYDALSQDGNRIQTLLDWYEIHVNEIKKPKVLNAKSFCGDQVFPWLEGVMDEENQENDQEKNWW